MVKQAGKLIPAILGRVLFIGLSVQIILGILWTFFAMPGFRRFEDTFFYLEVSEALVFDEYTGILYPLLLRLLRGVCSILPIPYFCILYVLQLAAAYFSAAFLTDCLWGAKGFWRVWGALVIVTVPVGLLCHLSVLPLSMAGSCFLVQLGCLCRMAGGKEDREKLLPLCLLQGAFCILGGLLLPEYVLFGAVAGVLSLICALKKKHWWGMGVVLASLILVAGINGLVQKPGALGRMQRSWQSMVLERVAFNHLNDTWFVWPGEMEEFRLKPELADVAHNAMDRREILGPMFEERFGLEGSKEKYLELVRAYLVYLKPEMLIQLRWDAFGYFLPPLATEALMEGKGYYNYVAKNYDAFLGDAPVLSCITYRYYTGWFVPGAALAFLTLGFVSVRDLLRKRTGFLQRLLPYVLCAVSACVIPFWYTLQTAGTMDEKNSFVYLGMWYALMAGACIRVLGKERDRVAK